MNRGKLISVSIGVTIFLAVVFLFLREFDISKKIGDDKAFLNTVWGMSQSEVEKANKNKLESAPYYFRGLQDMEGSSLYITNVDRFKNKVDSNLQLWGHSSKVVYEFFDDKLFQFTVELSGNNSKQLDSLIINNISKEYGKSIVGAGPESSFKFERYWQTDKILVHYWLIESEDLINKNKIKSEDLFKKDKIKSEDSKGLRVIHMSEMFGPPSPRPLRATVRVKYKPMIEQISKISSEEHSNIF